jgi:hypothetical protein
MALFPGAIAIAPKLRALSLPGVFLPFQILRHFGFQRRLQ